MQGRLPGGKLTTRNRGGILKFTVSGGDRVESLLMEGPTEITEILELDI